MLNNQLGIVVKNKEGFSLLELAIVLVLLSVLFSGILVPQREQRYQQQEEQNLKLLAQIKQNLFGFFIANKRLPCPATNVSGGAESLVSGINSECSFQYGFLPFLTLGLQGIVSQDKLFLDAWQRPIRYAISNRDYNNNDNWDWIFAADVSSESTLSNLVGNLKVCDRMDCSNIVYTREAVAVIHSLGKLDKQTLLEQENSGETVVLVNSKQLGMANDNTFIYIPQKNLTEQNYFDDSLLWIAPIELYYYLVD